MGQGCSEQQGKMASQVDYRIFLVTKIIMPPSTKKDRIPNFVVYLLEHSIYSWPGGQINTEQENILK